MNKTPKTTKPVLTKANTNIGVAFSGSGFLFPAHVGALQAILDQKYNITEIAGTSGGGIVAILYASGMKVPEMLDLIMTQDWSIFLKPKLFNWWNGICNPTPLYNFLLQQTNSKKFGDTLIPLTVCTTDIASGQGFDFSTKTTPDVELALGGRATSSIPFIYPSVIYQDKILMDGGIVNNIPVDKLSTNLPRFGIELSGGNTKLAENKVFDVAKQLVDILFQANEDTHVFLARQTGAQVITVETAGHSFLDGNLSPEERVALYNTGYTTAKKVLNSLAVA